MNKYFFTFLFLTNATVQLDAMTETRRNGLIWAINANETKVALWLIEQAPLPWLNQLHPDPLFGPRTVLMQAAHKNNSDIVKGLLERGVAVNAVDLHGKAALEELVSDLIHALHLSPGEFSRVTQLLLNHGATFDRLLKFEPICTPLLLFSIRGYTQEVQVLLDAANKPDNENNTVDGTSRASEQPPRKKRKL